MPAPLSIDLESVVDEFEQSWRQGKPPQLDSFLPKEHPVGGASRLLLLRELIKIDLEFRWRQSVARHRLEDYVKQFPELLQQGKVPLDLIAEEYRVRQRWADKPAHQEYLTRFPEHAAYLAATLHRIDAELAAEFIASVETVDPNALTSPPPMAQVLDEPPLPHIPGYEILGVLGRGGMGVVYKAKHVALKRLVALKMILSGVHADSDQLARFQAEAEAVARLKHPNIVQIYDVGTHDGLPYFALEYVEGGSLDKLLAGTPQDPRTAAELVRVLADAMHAAHQAGIVHRDLKPANVLLSPLLTGGEGPGVWGLGAPKITDFGLAKQLDSNDGHTRSGVPMGTPSYMAPEQAAGRTKEISAATDVYALGAILYEMLTGRPPFKAATALETVMLVSTEEPVSPRLLQPSLSKDLETICLKCLQKDPRKRYATAVGLAEDLRRFQEGEPILARPVGTPERAWRWARRHPAVATLMAALVLLTALVGVLLVVEYGRRASDQQRVRAEGLAEDFRAQKEAAEKLQAEAETLRRRAETAEAEARRLMYAGQLAQAQSAWQGGDAAVARNLLDACRLDDRGWEHAHLRQRFDETQVTLRGHARQVNSVCFSPDGMCVASASGNVNDEEPGEVNVWDVATGKNLRTLKGDTSGVWSVCFSPDGKRLATASGNVFASDNENGNHVEPGEVKVWDAATGQNLLTLKGHADVVWSVCFSPDGKRLASGSFDQTVKIWDTVTGDDLHTLKGHTGKVLSVAFSPDGKRLASGSRDWSLKVWDVATGKEVLPHMGHKRWVRSVSFSPDGKYLASASDDKTVKVWDAGTGKEMRAIKGHTNWVLNVGFSPDSRRLASASVDQTVKVWDVGTGQELLALTGHTHWVRSVCFSPDGQRLASASRDQTVKLWYAATGQDLLTLKGHTGIVLSVVFSPDGQRLASGSGNLNEDGPGEVKVWDAAASEKVLNLKGHLEGFVSSVCFNPDGKRLVSAGGDLSGKRGEIKVWDVAIGKELFSLKGHARGVNCVVFSSNGECLASASSDRTLKVWDAATGKELFFLKGHASDVHCVVFSPDGKRLASASGDKTVKVWDAATQRDLVTLKGHLEGVASVCFSPDGKRLASGSNDKAVKVWDAATGQNLLTLNGHIGRVKSVCFSPDGKRIASASLDQTVKVWDAATGQDLVTLKGHLDPVSSVCFSPDGKRLASASEDGTVKLWDTATGQDQRSSDLVFLAQLNDVPTRLRWHRSEAADSESKQQWFAAAFHLRQLIAAGEIDAEKLRGRLKRCEEKLLHR